MARLTIAVLLAGCLVQPVETRVPARRIGPLAGGVHEFRGSDALLVYEVSGRGPVCLARTSADASFERRFTVVYFNTKHRRYLTELERHVGLPLPRCTRREIP